ncbi:MAG: hypothetical protein AB7O65_09285 [Candidatus Korobacteraceae bacterium]
MKLQAGFWAVALAVNALQNFALRHTVVSDTVPYLEISDGMLNGDWARAVNTLWSPLYPAVLALLRAIVKPEPWWEFATVHAANFLIFGATIAAFDFLIRAAGFHRNPYRLIIAYTAFLWASLALIGPVSTPDMLLFLFVYISAGILIKIRNGDGSVGSFLLLGLSLGVGFLAKAPLFPLAPLFLLLAFEKTRRPAALAAGMAAFLLVAGPYVALLSQKEGRLTFGDSGRLNYLWHVNRFQLYGDCVREQLQTSPPIYALRTNSTRNVSDPAYFDPGEWCRGITPQVSLKHQIFHTTKITAEFFEASPPSLFLGAVLACAVVTAGSILRGWPLILPCLVAFAMFSLVHVEWRYLAGFLVLAVMGIFEGLRPDRRTALAVALAAGLAIPIAISKQVYVLRNPAVHQEVAARLLELGLREGDPVATVIGGADNYWARLARVRIVALVPKEYIQNFWGGSQQASLETFRNLGAKIVVTSQVPAWRDVSSWKPLGYGYYAYWLR